MRNVYRSSKIKMSYINIFLKTEITCIPKLLGQYLGDYYNNAWCNGATWVFILWCIFHLIFDKFLEIFLKELRYKEYARKRLRSSLWYLGFYVTGVVYCGATLSRNEVELFNLKRMHVPSDNNISTQVILGYTLISTFYLHSAFWEGLRNGYVMTALGYSFLFAFMVSSNVLRVVEISFTLTALTGIAQVATEAIRCCSMYAVPESYLTKLIYLLYLLTFGVCAVYIVFIPMTFIIPLGLKILSDYPNILLLFLFINLISWLGVALYESILFKFIDHCLYHNKELEKTDEASENPVETGIYKCSSTLLECSLFKPRDDFSHNLQILRRKLKIGNPSIIAVKQKISKKRESETSESQSDKSEISEIDMSNITDDKGADENSDPEFDSNDDESSTDESNNNDNCKIQETGPLKVLYDDAFVKKEDTSGNVESATNKGLVDAKISLAVVEPNCSANKSQEIVQETEQCKTLVKDSIRAVSKSDPEFVVESNDPVSSRLLLKTKSDASNEVKPITVEFSKFENDDVLLKEDAAEQSKDRDNGIDDLCSEQKKSGNKMEGPVLPREPSCPTKSSHPTPDRCQSETVESQSDRDPTESSLKDSGQ